MTRAEDGIPEAGAFPDALQALPRGSLLLPYQQRAVTAVKASQLMVIEKSRRIGLTWGLAALAALTGAARRGEGGMNVYYMGYEKEMTREFIEVVAQWANAFGIAAEAAEEVLLDESAKDGGVQAFRIRFASGFSVYALPSVARGLRGRQGLVILDEAAFASDLAEILKAALALLIWGGKVCIVSTHDGIDNPFNQLIDEIRSGKREGETLTITFQDAMDDGFYERVCLVRGEQPTPDGKAAWEAKIRAIYGEDASEELDCIPKTGSGSWLNPSDIAAAQHPEAGRPAFYAGGPVYQGWDVARRRDLSVLAPFEKVGLTLWLREELYMRGQSFADQYAEIDRRMAQYQTVRLAIDQTGMGEAPVERMQRVHGQYRVEGVILSGPQRLVLATALREAFENGLIRIPDNPDIRADLRAIKKVSGPTGAPRLVNDDTVHADIFWAYALAVAAAQDSHLTPWTPVDLGKPEAGTADAEDPFIPAEAMGALW